MRFRKVNQYTTEVFGQRFFSVYDEADVFNREVHLG